jgi:copper chaperone
MSTTATSKKTVLRAEGFSCPSCVTKIETQLNRLDGVSDAKVHFASSRIEVQHDPSRADVDQLVAAVKKAGYTAKPSAF